ncbi:MAG TPA: hypothetical protein VM510_05915 [Caulifigura sp.]|nr:hypothetical protein [Caulifigura sp.]
MRSAHSLTAAALVVAMAFNSAIACPFCPIADATFNEQLNQAEVALVVQWVSSRQADKKGDPGETTYRVVKVLKQPSTEFAGDSLVTLATARTAQPDALFLVMGVYDPGVQWKNPIAVTETSVKYILESPGRDAPAAQRLPYFLNHLDHPDLVISNDAFSEFAGAPYQDIAPLADRFSPALLKKWIADPATSQTRIGFYGMMLGLSGTKADAPFLKSHIEQPTETFRLGLDGMLGGYVLLLREEGLPLLEARLNPAANITESYAAMQALRFLWEYAPECVGKDRLRQSMRKALDRPELAELAVSDLTRWEDWESMSRLVKMFDSPTYREKNTRRAVARYLITLSSKKVAAGDELTARRVSAAKAELMALRERDAVTVKDAERFRL